MDNCNINILILGAGATVSSEGGDSFPAFMTEINGKPLIQRLIEACAELSPAWIGIACQASEIETYRLDELPNLLHPRAEYVKTNGTTGGAACTALLASQRIDNNSELLLLGINEYIDVDFFEKISEFRKRTLDGGVLTFKSIHPRYSYVKTGTNGLVELAAEKRPISDTAAATFFWYKKGSDFVGAAKDLIRKQDQVGGLYYISSTINQLLLKQKRIGTAEIENEKYYPLKTTRQMENFETVQEIRRQK